MSIRIALEAVLLAAVVFSCWAGVLGMLRVAEPIQALHFLGLPACFGAPVLVVAVFLAVGNTNTSWKTLLLALVLLATNSVVTHAVARAFRTRELGHWQPLPGDAVEFIHASDSEAAQS